MLLITSVLTLLALLGSSAYEFSSFTLSRFDGKTLVGDNVEFTIFGEWYLPDAVDDKRIEPLLLIVGNLRVPIPLKNLVVTERPATTQWIFEGPSAMVKDLSITHFKDNRCEIRFSSKPVSCEIDTLMQIEIVAGEHNGLGHATLEIDSTDEKITHFKLLSFKQIYSHDDDEEDDDTNILENDFLPPGALMIEGASETAFNSLDSTIGFFLNSSTFLNDTSAFYITVNGLDIYLLFGSDIFSVGKYSVTVESGVLTSGENVVSFEGMDVHSRPIFGTFHLWSGPYTLVVRIVDEFSNLITNSLSVVLQGAGLDFAVSCETVDGTCTFYNLPGVSVFVTITDNIEETSKLQGATSNDGTLTIVMKTIPVSDVDNNDFTQGTLGWNFESNTVTIVGHLENPGPANALSYNAEFDRQQYEDLELKRQNEPEVNLPIYTVQDGSNNDMILSTLPVEGSQFLSRAFTAGSDTIAATIRYRFVTTEFPTYFGSQYNDYYSVSVTSGTSSVVDVSDMNTLGYYAFNPTTKSTAWKELLIFTQPNDKITVEIMVGNAGDGAYQSSVIVDYIELSTGQLVNSLSWDSVNGGLAWSGTVIGSDLTSEMRVRASWARSNTVTSVLYDITEIDVFPSGSPVGTTRTKNIPGQTLANAPSLGNFIIVSSLSYHFESIADTKVKFGTQARVSAVSESSLAIIRELLRYAGEPSCTITSTSRTPSEQANAMFNNLMKSSSSIQQNIDAQYALYGAGGDAVIDVFVAATQGKTRDEILEDKSNILTLMTVQIEINPRAVSKHCADPTSLNVVDIAVSTFANGNSLSRFVAAAAAHPSISQVIDERNSNNCIHLEIPQSAATHAGIVDETFATRMENLYYGVMHAGEVVFGKEGLIVLVSFLVFASFALVFATKLRNGNGDFTALDTTERNNDSFKLPSAQVQSKTTPRPVGYDDFEI